MKIKKIKTQRKLYKELYTHYLGLYTVSVDEFKFQNLQIKFLQNLLEEIETLNNKNVSRKLINSVIKNGFERQQIDKLIHYNLIVKDIKNENTNI